MYNSESHVHYDKHDISCHCDDAHEYSVNFNYYSLCQFLWKYINLIGIKRLMGMKILFIPENKKKSNQSAEMLGKIRRIWTYGRRKILWYHFRPHDHLQIGNCSSYVLCYIIVLNNWTVLVLANITVSVPSKSLAKLKLHCHSILFDDILCFL